MTEPLLSVQDVRLRFGGVLALDGVSFDIAPGLIVGLIGPNGAGKTSLFNCVSRLYQPSSGSILFDGHELLRLRPHEVINLGISRTFQNVALFQRMTVLDNVLVGDHAVESNIQPALKLSGGRRPNAGNWAGARAGRADCRDRNRSLRGSRCGQKASSWRARWCRATLLLLDNRERTHPGDVGELSELVGVSRRVRADGALVEHHELVVSISTTWWYELDTDRRLGPDEVHNVAVIGERTWARDGRCAAQLAEVSRLRPGRGAARYRSTDRGRRNRLDSGRQRRGQDHDAARHFRFDFARGSACVQGSVAPGKASLGCGAAGHRARAGGARDDG
jgi:ABC-type branched-subunit amino acid transport system ATPase component